MPFFSKKVPFLVSTERCPEFLEYALQANNQDDPTDWVEDMFERIISPNIFCVKKASYTGISLREVIRFHSSIIVPTLMVFNQTQTYKTCYYGPETDANTTYTSYLIICKTYIYKQRYRQTRDSPGENVK